MHMDADARNSIIESMAPRAAANTLASMEDALQQAQDARPESPEVCVCVCSHAQHHNSVFCNGDCICSIG
jgi:hypothetical protein